MLIDSAICFTKTAFTINAIGEKKKESCIMNENRTKRLKELKQRQLKGKRSLPQNKIKHLNCVSY